MRYADRGGLSAAQRGKREMVRLQAAAMFAEGSTPAEVAGRFRVSLVSAYAWRNRWLAGGVEALRSKGHGGAQCRLTPIQQRELATLLDLGAQENGFDDPGWTLSRVAAVIERRFGHVYTLRGTSYLLHRMGWTPQVPARRAVERDDEAVATWHSIRWQAGKD